MKYDICPLKSLCSRVISGGTPKSRNSVYYEGDIPWLNTKEINFNRIYETERSISKLGLENSSAKWIEASAVIVAMYGATAGKTAVSLIPLTTNQACCNLEIKADKADFRFVYYYLKWKYTELASLANGGAQQNLNAQLIKDFPIMLPNLSTQHRIADILWSIDDKIELNNKINGNLHQQAQAIYREMFVSNGDITTATIADVSLNVTDGVHNTVHDDPDGKYFLLSCKNIKDGHLSISTNERTINEEVFSKLRRRTNLSKGDILISSVGTVGELLLLNTEPINYEFQRSVAIVKPNPTIISSYYLYESLSYQKAELINAAHGAVQQCLFISDIARFPIGVPTPEALLKFNSIVEPIFDAITANEATTAALCSIRDALLPRLMSGEIDVSDLYF